MNQQELRGIIAEEIAHHEAMRSREFERLPDDMARALFELLKVSPGGGKVFVIQQTQNPNEVQIALKEHPSEVILKVWSGWPGACYRLGYISMYWQEDNQPTFLLMQRAFDYEAWVNKPRLFRWLSW